MFRWIQCGHLQKINGFNVSANLDVTYVYHVVRMAHAELRGGIWGLG